MGISIQFGQPHPFLLAGRNLDPEELQHYKIIELQNHYLEKHNNSQCPLKILLTGAAMVAAVATVVFCNLVGLTAVAAGLGVFGILMGISKLTLNLFSTINQKAADALISPGFYEHAEERPRRISSAEAIVNAHNLWVATNPDRGE